MKRWMGVMAVINEPSTEPAGGSMGLNVVLTMESAIDIVAQAPGTYLCDEHVNMRPAFYRSKLIGKIEEAVIVDNKIVVSGSVSDEYVERHKDTPYLGLSLEAKGLDAKPDWRRNQLIINKVDFKGVAVLDNPAYRQSSFSVIKEF